mgnify:CR=1 FL=1
MLILYILLYFCSLSLSTTIYVPDDFDTIQEGIDEAITGDTVLVAPSSTPYIENLIIEKTITLASHAIFDNLSNGWVIENLDGTYGVIDNINNTVINGSNSENQQSVIFINSPEGSNECITPEIIGFTITDGSGTIVLVETQNAVGQLVEVEQRMGGGIFINNALPIINYNFIKDCNCGDRECALRKGGAIQHSNGGNFPALHGIQSLDYRCEGDLNFTNNMYYNNQASYSSTLGTSDFSGYIDLRNSYFDVYAVEEQKLSSYWIDVDENVEYDASNSIGIEDAINSNVYVSPLGDDSNSGLTEEDAFLTIQKALEMIYITEDNNATIILSDSIFSPMTTGESFPINLISNLTLKGQGKNLTILSSDRTNRVLFLENCSNCKIENLTIKNGLSDDSWNWGGIGGGMLAKYCDNLIINDVLFTENEALWDAGGIHLFNSSFKLDNTDIIRNTAYYNGGMVIARYIDEILNGEIHNSIISKNFSTHEENSSYWGGASASAFALYNMNLLINNVTIVDNIANDYNGAILLFGENVDEVKFINTIIWGNKLVLPFSDDYVFGEYNASHINNLSVEYSNTDWHDWYGNINVASSFSNNINTDPLFQDYSNENYNLLEGSPCIDAGTADLDGDGIEDIFDYYGIAPDIGAFEYSNYLIGDLNDDQITNILDIVMLVNIIFSGEQNSDADINGDSLINILDVIILVNIVLE